MTNGYGQDVQSKTFTTAGPGDAQIGGGLMSPKSSPPMDVSMRNLGQNIERLQQAVQVLQNKLEPVLYSEPPTPTMNGNVGVEARAPRASSGLGSTVNSFADQIEGITDRVNQMIRRCEL